MDKKYQSSTTILVQREKVLNPLMGYQMAVTMASEDRLRTFNEIVYSHTTMKQVYDSLYKQDNLDGTDEQIYLVNLRNKISTQRRGDSFRITFTSKNPRLAQATVGLLADIFMGTILGAENQRNDQTVEFFQKKLGELRGKYESSQRQFVSTLRSKINAMPIESQVLYTQLGAVEKQISSYEIKNNLYKDKLNVLKTFPDAMNTEEGRQALYDLQRVEIPFVLDLQNILKKYDEMTRRYSRKYPEVQEIETQIVDLLRRIQTAIETEISNEESSRLEAERQRIQIIEELKNASLNQRIGQTDDSEYAIYKKLYDDVMIKLEQAIATRELGKNANNQFIVIDPPLVPLFPSGPGKTMIVFGSFGIAIFLGILSVILREMFDTTIRTGRDLEVYQKPIVGYISDGSGKS